MDKTKASAFTACPMCADVKFVTFCNKQIDREVMELKIYCTNNKKGCKWIGELREINFHHENSNGCQLEVVNCSNNCGKTMQRKSIKTHIAKSCPLRKTVCQHCHKTGAFQFIKGDHKNECQKFPVNCPNNCDIGTICRENIQAHRKECPLEMIDCEYHSMGCKVKVPRKRKVEHEDKNEKKHLKMTKQKLEDTEQRLTNLESALHQLISSSKIYCGHLTLTAHWSNHLTLLARMSASSIQVCPVVIRMSSFSTKEMMSSGWYSNPFYTQHKGYLMRLVVYAGGNVASKGINMSVYMQPGKGAHDDKLTWPLTGKFEITILNQINDNEHYSRQLIFDDNTPTDVKSRVAVDSDHLRCRGFDKFISSTILKATTSRVQFLKKDCIYIRVHTLL